MGIRLDWEIEAEQKHIRGTGEDPDGRGARRGRYLRLFLTAAIAIGIVAAGIGYILYRLDQVNDEIEQVLRDTVEAEVATLRIGDWSAFAAIQRSATGQWLAEQRFAFDDYQELLRTDPTAQLTGTILDVTVEDPRARVQVQEIIDGVPYTRTWFYFRYEEDENGDGIADSWQWFHVPPDVEFWGEPATIEYEHVTVEYRTVDNLFAEQVANRLHGWITQACAALACDPPPALRVTIVSDAPTRVDWSPEDPWHLIMLSPYVEGARSDQPFDFERQVATADLFARRLVGTYGSEADLAVGTDGYFLQWQAVVPWLTGRFIQVNTESHLIDSLASNYGEETVGRLLRQLQPESWISMLTEVTGVPLDEATLDWRDFFTWRLLREQELIAQGNTDAVAQLYDTSDDAAVQQAFRRAAQAPINEEIEVIVVQRTSPSADGRAQLLATAHIGTGASAVEQQILFRLQTNVWKRAD